MTNGDRADLVLVILAVEDLARAKAFYERAFDWEMDVDVPVFVQLRTRTPGLSVGLYQREAYAANTNELPAPAPAGGITATELYVLVEDLEAALARAEEAGARRLSDPAERSWGDRAAYVADPDGNVIAFATSGHED